MALGTQFVNKILPEEINKTDGKHVKGVFTGERNYNIACRFYFHFTIKGMRYERCLAQLNKEFNLSELRIAQLIMMSGDDLERLKKNKVNKKYLAKKLPHFNWN